MTSKQMASEISASRPSIYQAMRCMSSSKLFVGCAYLILLFFFLYFNAGAGWYLSNFIAGISFQTNDNSLKEAFDKYGNVVEGTWMD